MSDAQTLDLPPRWVGAAFSLFVHTVLIALLVTQLRAVRSGQPAPSAPKAIQITMAPPAPPRPKVVQPPEPPKPIEPPKEQPKVSTVPTPLPTKPKPVQKPSPAPTPPAAAAPTPAPPSPPVVETPEESLIGRIHDNWLEPASLPRNLNCRIRIDYLVGGRIAAIKFLNACGAYDVEESVRKAIYKSQPLPLLAAKTATGSVEIEFTP